MPYTLPLQTQSGFFSLFQFISSFSAFRDYLKLIVLGGAFETFRRLYSMSYTRLVDRFFITATFDSEDFAFQWIMLWLSSLPQWRQFRDFSVSTSVFGLDDDVVELDDNVDEVTRRRTPPVRYLPSYASSYGMWYKGRYISISRIKEDSRWFSDKSILTITIFSRDRSILDSLILEARKKWISARGNSIEIFANEGSHVASRPKRPLTSIVLDDGIKELLLEDANDFLKSKQWYADRGIPFRRGYLLYGPPGSGKTSIIHSLAGELGLNIHIISLSKSGLDDVTLNSLISSLPQECIAVMEDIDAAFTHGLTRGDSRDGQGQGFSQIPSSGAKDSRITLSGLLNALDGISAQEGRLLFATTNRYDVLDPALIRPGRMDLHVEFRLASRYQARELFKHFYYPNNSESTTADENDQETSTDSGYVTPTKEDSGPTPTGVPSDGSARYSGTAHSIRAPKLSRKRIESLAERYSERIPEREFSTASLQGYLMTHKTRPLQAVEDVEKWVKETREGQGRRAGCSRR
ncbi:P-loop containing nucleoside triphosphate hydrolase protein [Lactifluus volemus]|nr:P-loop containing nucleoside triphosphate hydrolase protein [Lactifluus volemus]